MNVYLLEHIMIHDDYEDVKFIGVFTSKDNAIKAINKLADKPGFCNAKRILNPFIDDNISGFIIDKCKVDNLAWQDGFG